LKGLRRAGLVSSLSSRWLLFTSSCTHLVSELRASNCARERQFPRERNNDLIVTGQSHDYSQIWNTVTPISAS
jgi:hypothetical protein